MRRERPALVLRRLIEDRTESVDHGLVQLATWSHGLAEDPEVWCDAVLHAMTRGRRIGDDIVLICLRLGRAHGKPAAAVPPPADVGRPGAHAARAAELGTRSSPGAASRGVVAPGVQRGADERPGARIQGGSPGAVDLLVESVESGQVRIRVTDSGRWRHDPGERDRGRGLGLINQLSRKRHAGPVPRGTTVTIVIRTDYSAPNGGRAGTLRHGQGR